MRYIQIGWKGGKDNVGEVRDRLCSPSSPLYWLVVHASSFHDIDAEAYLCCGCVGCCIVVFFIPLISPRCRLLHTQKRKNIRATRPQRLVQSHKERSEWPHNAAPESGRIGISRTSLSFQTATQLLLRLLLNRHRRIAA